MSNSEVDADYNLYYASTLNTAIVYSGAGYHMNDIATIRSKFGWEMHSPTSLIRYLFLQLIII